MMEYPGTMRPGRRRENVPFEDLPLDNIDDIPIPWPYFQELEWHHQFPAPHDNPVDVEDYIEELGRWATVEDEAEMRRDARKGLKDRKAQEKEKLAHQIMDDTEDDDDYDFTAQQTAPSPTGLDFLTDSGTDKEDEKDDDDEEDSDDFLASLGLDTDIEDQTAVQTTTDEDDDDELPDLDFDEDDNDDNADDSVTEVVPLDSLNEADELDDKTEEISYDQDTTNEYDDGGFDFDFDDMDDVDGEMSMGGDDDDNENDVSGDDD